jgi:nucleoside 2-deoxyribosyltransferase
MKYYIAASLKDQEEANRLATSIGVADHQCTSRWLGEIEAKTPAGCKATALRCFEDIDKADVVVHVSKPKGHPNPSPGRMVELGYALARGKPVILLGPLGETVFHFVPNIFQANTVREVVSLMSRLKIGSPETTG